MMCMATSFVHLKRGREMHVEIPRPLALAYSADVINHACDAIENELSTRGINITIVPPSENEPCLFTILAHDDLALDPRLIIAAVCVAPRRMRKQSGDD